MARVVVVAPLAIVLAALTGFASAFGIILLAVAAIMLSTGVVGFCALYAPPLLHGAEPAGARLTAPTVTSITRQSVGVAARRLGPSVCHGRHD